MTEAQRKQFFAIRKALDSFVDKIVENTAEINENLTVIREWHPGEYLADDVRMFDGIPYRCVQGHDSAGNDAWNPADTPSLWMQYHGTSKTTARPWIAPTGAHDRYKVSEWMIWTDGLAYPCKIDTNFSPDEYPDAWGSGEEL